MLVRSNSMVFPYCRLTGKVAVVNAGSNRIGASTVELFREHGEKLIIADIQDDCSQATVNKLSENLRDSWEPNMRLGYDLPAEQVHVIHFNHLYCIQWSIHCIEACNVGLAKNSYGEYGIRLNCISPYAVWTNIGGERMGRDGGCQRDWEFERGYIFLKAEGIAKAVIYLASDAAAPYVSGLNLVVDGGFGIVNASLKMALTTMKYE
ncbi:tropinone reductase-like 2 [Actinidia eriantha]|uniref:tropinone reductase-like 2 n=1 Tax=Actinidia eriantha TaxID=165200 RepID=UPI00258BBAC0|nr:tropinone reductase-like 2 [Actinidia eriantha]